MDNIMTIGSLLEYRSVAVPTAVWTPPGLKVALPVARGGRSGAPRTGCPEHQIRIRNLVNPSTDLPFADRLRVSASEP